MDSAYEMLLKITRLTKSASTIHGSGYDKAMSMFSFQPEVKPSPQPVDPGFTNKQTSQDAFKRQQSSVPYVSVNEDSAGNPYLNGAQTQKNIFGGDADFQRRAEAQQAYARWKQSRPGGLTRFPKVPSLDHPVTLNPSGKDERGVITAFKNYGPVASGNPNRNVSIEQDTGEQFPDGEPRSNYNPNDDKIGMASMRFPTNGTAFPEPMHTLLPGVLTTHIPERDSGEELYRGISNNSEKEGPLYHAQNVLQEEATHAQSPTSFYKSIDKNNDPTVFSPKDRLPGEYVDDGIEPRRPYTPIVPGMQGSYDQWPGEFVKSRKLDQNDAQATYGHRIQNSKELLDYHNMQKVYGTDDEWTNSQANLTQQHAQALGRLRAQSMQQRQQDHARQQEEYNQSKRPTPPAPVQQMSLKPVQSTYDFIDQTDLMKQVRNNQQLGRMDKVASTPGPNYDRLMNEVRMMKIATVLRKATDDLKLSDRSSGKRIQSARVMSTPTSTELMEQKRESEGDGQAKQASRRVGGLFRMLVG